MSDASAQPRRASRSDGPTEPATRSAEQIAHERAMAEVSDVLMNLGHALGRARKARRKLGLAAAERNARPASDEVVAALAKARAWLQTDTIRQR